MLAVQGCMVPSAKSLFQSRSLPTAVEGPAVICPSGGAAPVFAAVWRATACRRRRCRRPR